MVRIKGYIVLVVWLLLAVFTLPTAAQSIHIYRTVEHAGHHCEDAPHHDCDDCPICQFTYSSFTETRLDQYNFEVIHSDFKHVFSYNATPDRQVIFVHGLRAPPAA